MSEMWVQDSWRAEGRGLREEGLLVWEEFSGELVKETRGSLGRGTLTY